MDLHETVRANNEQHVRLLMEQGVDKNKGDSYGDTPLMLASKYSFLPLAQYLVEQGATLDKANNYAVPLSWLLHAMVILR